MVAPLALIFTVFVEPLKLFIHISGVFKLMVIIGKLITVTVLTAVLVQVACSPMMEYVVVSVGFTVTFVPTVALMAVFGDQV